MAKGCLFLLLSELPVNLAAFSDRKEMERISTEVPFREEGREKAPLFLYREGGNGTAATSEQQKE